MEQPVALYFGSFNPVHNGHLNIARYVLEKKICNEVWFVISPRNPLKPEAELADERHRLNMLKLALEDVPFMKICDIELSMPRPSYTIDTLIKFTDIYHNTEFQIIMGMDNLRIFIQWKSWEEILEKFRLLVYPRENHSDPPFIHPNITVMNDAPLFDVSSCSIRGMIAEGLSEYRNFLPGNVALYIKRHSLYLQKNC